MDPHDATRRDDATHPHDAAAIANELYRYAELIDAGRFTELGELMEHCTFSYEEDVYNPARFGEMVKDYLRRKKTLAAEAEES